jgi:acyl carrier protein
MAMNEVTERVRTLVAEVLCVPRSIVMPDLSRDALPQWDSLGHLRLVTALEAEFSVRPTMNQIAEIRTVRDLAQLAGQ